MTLKPSSQLNFSRSNTPIDPSEGLIRSTGVMAQALIAQDNAAERDRKALLDARQMDLQVAAAQRAEEAAKMQRTEWEQKQGDRTADRAFLADVAKAPEYTYRSITDKVTASPEAKAQVDALEIPKSIMDKVKLGGWDESTKTMRPNDYSALSAEEKAQMTAIEDKQALAGQDLVEKAKISLSKVDQIEDILKNSKNITPAMYTALEAAKKEQKAEAAAAAALVAEERKGLETYLRDLRKDTAKDLVVDRGTYTLESSTGGGSSGTGTSGGKTKAATGWAADKTVQDQLNELSIMGWGSDTEKGERLAQIAMTKGLSANEFKDILASATTEGASGYRTLRGNTFINPETGEEDAGMYLADKIDELAAKKEASGYGGSPKTSNKTIGFYNKNDPRAALSYRANEIANTEARINALRKINTTPQTRAEKEAAADEAILARLAQGLDGTTPTASAVTTPVETVKKSVQKPKPRTNQGSTGGVGSEVNKKTAEEIPLVAPVRPDIKNFDTSTKTGQEAYAKAVSDYGKANKEFKAKTKNVAEQQEKQQKAVNSEKEKMVTPMKARLSSIVDEDPTSSFARTLTSSIEGDSYRRNITTDKSALKINNVLEEEGVIKRVGNKDKVETVSTNIASLQELLSSEKDENTKRAYQTAIYHQMHSLPKNNPVRIEFDEALKSQDSEGVRGSILAAAELATLGRVGSVFGQVKTAYREGTDIARKAAWDQYKSKRAREWFKKEAASEFTERGAQSRGLIKPTFGNRGLGQYKPGLGLG